MTQKAPHPLPLDPSVNQTLSALSVCIFGCIQSSQIKQDQEAKLKLCRFGMFVLALPILGSTFLWMAIYKVLDPYFGNSSFMYIFCVVPYYLTGRYCIKFFRILSATADRVRWEMGSRRLDEVFFWNREPDAIDMFEHDILQNHNLPSYEEACNSADQENVIDSSLPSYEAAMASGSDNLPPPYVMIALPSSETET